MEQVEPTTSAKVLRAIAPPPPASIREDVRRLLELASGDDDDVLRMSLLGYVRAHGEPMSAAISWQSRGLPGHLLVDARWTVS